MNEQLDRIEAKLNAMQVSVDKTRSYLMWGFWITVAVIVLPLFILPLFLPAFLGSVTLPAGI